MCFPAGFRQWTWCNWFNSSSIEHKNTPRKTQEILEIRFHLPYLHKVEALSSVIISSDRFESTRLRDKTPELRAEAQLPVLLSLTAIQTFSSQTAAASTPPKLTRSKQVSRKFATKSLPVQCAAKNSRVTPTTRSKWPRSQRTFAFWENIRTIGLKTTHSFSWAKVDPQWLSKQIS